MGYGEFIGIVALFFGAKLIHDPVYYGFGLRRTYSAIEDFPYTCRKLRHPLLEACEDMVLDESGRKLYATCSTSLTRAGWLPGANHYNASARELKDHVSVLNIDEPGKDGLFGLHTLEITGGYKSATGGSETDFIGLDFERLPNDDLKFWIINHRVPVDEVGNLLDAKTHGANSTIEEFDLTPGTTDLKFVKTYHSESIQTPNTVVATGEGGFIFSNDHGDFKAGPMRELSALYCPGNVGFCDPDGTCGLAYTKGDFPNGVARDRDGLYYVAQTSAYRILVYSWHPEIGRLKKVSEILMKMAIDNISIDSAGDIFTTGFPKPLCLRRALKDPHNVDCPATIFRIQKFVTDQGELLFDVERYLEDKDAKFLPVATSVVHDVKNDMMFVGSMVSPYMTVCERKP